MRPTLCQFLLFFSIFPVRKKYVSVCGFVKAKIKGIQIFFYLPKQTRNIIFFVKAKQKGIFLNKTHFLCGKNPVFSS